MVLLNNDLYILGSRRDKITQTIRTISLNNLSEQFTDGEGKTQGGIIDLGDLEEGFCLEANFNL